MLVRIEAVVSVSGGENLYLANRLGQFLLGRSFKHQIVTFLVDVTDLEFRALAKIIPELTKEEIDKEFGHSANPVQLVSIQIKETSCQKPHPKE